MFTLQQGLGTPSKTDTDSGRQQTNLTQSKPNSPVKRLCLWRVIEACHACKPTLIFFAPYMWASNLKLGRACTMVTRLLINQIHKVFKGYLNTFEIIIT